VRHHPLIPLFLLSATLVLLGEDLPGLSQPPAGKQDQGKKKAENLEQWAEVEFRKRDRDGDGYLNSAEAPGKLRDDFARWDANGDSRIDLAEFKRHFRDSVRAKLAKSESKLQEAMKWLKPPTVIDAREPPRVVVYRAGNLPKELPPWFRELDANRDGQVSLAEWLRVGKAAVEFATMDRNDDGLLTIEETLRFFRLRAPGEPSSDDILATRVVIPGLTPLPPEEGKRGP
jgi:Ca2+-binding EF-hand superfamily protein